MVLGRLGLLYAARRVLERNSVSLPEVGAVLDFGCGYGGIIRHWADLPVEIHGCDYNPVLIDWCRRPAGAVRGQLP